MGKIIDDFITWFFDCLVDFRIAFIDTIERGFELLATIFAWIVFIALTIILSPIWIPFFIIWFLFVRDKEEK